MFGSTLAFGREERGKRSQEPQWKPQRRLLRGSPDPNRRQHQAQEVDIRGTVFSGGGGDRQGTFAGNWVPLVLSASAVPANEQRRGEVAANGRGLRRVLLQAIPVEKAITRQAIRRTTGAASSGERLHSPARVPARRDARPRQNSGKSTLAKPQTGRLQDTP